MCEYKPIYSIAEPIRVHIASAMDMWFGKIKNLRTGYLYLHSWFKVHKGQTDGHPPREVLIVVLAEQ